MAATTEATPLDAEERAQAIKDEGNVFFKAGSYQNAISRYSKAISVAPAVASLYGNRSAAWYMIAQQSSQPKAFEECLRDCMKATELDPKLTKVYLRAIKTLVHLERFSSATDLANKAVAHVPDAPELVAERDAVCAMGKELAEAQAHLTNGEFALAKKCFVALDSRMSASCIPKLGLAEAEIGMDNASQALRHTLAAINLDGSSTEAYYLRGLALYLTQNLDQSKKHFQEALRLNPDHTKSQLAFKRVRNIERTLETAKECMERREYQEAVDSYTKAMEIDERNKMLAAVLAVERGNAYLRLKQFDLALEDCNAAIENDGSITAPLVTRSMCHTAMGNFEEAVADLEVALGIDPESLIIKERLKKAQTELRKSKRLDYYKILGISESASEPEIKAAYKKKALEWHPDKHGQAEEELQAKAVEMFNMVGEAQEILTHPRKKALFDEGYDKEMIEKRIQMEEQQAQMFGGGGFGGHPGFR